MILALSVAALCLSALPAMMFLTNLPLFRADLQNPTRDAGQISVLIPARDEAEGIHDCVAAALRSTSVTVEVVVLDDDSTDDTAGIVSRLGDSDSRVRLIRGRPLPAGWNGKQHACAQLAESATYDFFVFIDADVRLGPTALQNLLRYRSQNDIDLLSAFPHQVTITWSEQWLIPMMHFILLGYLPFSRMRSDNQPSMAAGCGQLFLTSRSAYETAGTHAAIKSSRHDGVKLPRAYRVAGLKTDVVDGTELAECRMYKNTGEVIRGALKNATEGIANPRLILVFTVLLLGCSALPCLAFGLAIYFREPIAIVVSTIALIAAHLPRWAAAQRLRQSFFGAACHIPATILFLILQWVALFNALIGRQVAWRGRTQS